MEPIEFEGTWLENVNINTSAITDLSKILSTKGQVSGENRNIHWPIKALTLTDLTTLAGDDTQSNVERLCAQAAYPLAQKYLKAFENDSKKCIHTAAVCVYPSRVKDAFDALTKLDRIGCINIAAVATGFPSGQYSLPSRLAEIRYAVESGANEIDIVVNRPLVLLNKWRELYDELIEMRRACGPNVHMKTILAIGECGSYTNVYKASMVAMMAGSDFIKTSTGKEAVNATLSVGLVMIEAIREFKRLTGRRIGLKPAGGIRTVNDAIAWMTMIKNTLGDEWLTPELFRFGASGLVDDIERTVRSGLVLN